MNKIDSILYALKINKEDVLFKFEYQKNSTAIVIIYDYNINLLRTLEFLIDYKDFCLLDPGYNSPTLYIAKKSSKLFLIDNTEIINYNTLKNKLENYALLE